MFSDVRCKCVYLDVAYVCNGFQVFFKCFFASVLEVCFKCFICLQTYVASVTYGCFKSKLDVVHGMCVGTGKGREWFPCAVWRRGRRPGAVGARNAGMLTRL
jgi:hypothetical protein